MKNSKTKNLSSLQIFMRPLVRMNILIASWNLRLKVHDYKFWVDKSHEEKNN